MPNSHGAFNLFPNKNVTVFLYYILLYLYYLYYIFIFYRKKNLIFHQETKNKNKIIFKRRYLF